MEFLRFKCRISPKIMSSYQNFTSIKDVPFPPNLINDPVKWIHHYYELRRRYLDCIFKGCDDVYYIKLFLTQIDMVDNPYLFVIFVCSLFNEEPSKPENYEYHQFDRALLALLRTRMCQKENHDLLTVPIQYLAYALSLHGCSINLFTEFVETYKLYSYNKSYEKFLLSLRQSMKIKDLLFYAVALRAENIITLSDIKYAYFGEFYDALDEYFSSDFNKVENFITALDQVLCGKMTIARIETTRFIIHKKTLEQHWHYVKELIIRNNLKESLVPNMLNMEAFSQMKTYFRKYFSGHIIFDDFIHYLTRILQQNSHVYTRINSLLAFHGITESFNCNLRRLRLGNMTHGEIFSIIGETFENLFKRAKHAIVLNYKQWDGSLLKISTDETGAVMISDESAFNHMLLELDLCQKELIAISGEILPSVSIKLPWILSLLTLKASTSKTYIIDVVTLKELIPADKWKILGLQLCSADAVVVYNFKLFEIPLYKIHDVFRLIRCNNNFVDLKNVHQMRTQLIYSSGNFNKKLTLNKFYDQVSAKEIPLDFREAHSYFFGQVLRDGQFSYLHDKLCILLELYSVSMIIFETKTSNIFNSTNNNLLTRTLAKYAFIGKREDYDELMSDLRIELSNQLVIPPEDEHLNPIEARELFKNAKERLVDELKTYRVTSDLEKDLDLLDEILECSLMLDLKLFLLEYENLDYHQFKILPYITVDELLVLAVDNSNSITLQEFYNFYEYYLLLFFVKTRGDPKSCEGCHPNEFYVLSSEAEYHKDLDEDESLKAGPKTVLKQFYKIIKRLYKIVRAFDNLDYFRTRKLSDTAKSLLETAYRILKKFNLTQLLIDADWNNPDRICRRHNFMNSLHDYLNSDVNKIKKYNKGILYATKETISELTLLDLDTSYIFPTVLKLPLPLIRIALARLTFQEICELILTVSPYEMLYIRPYINPYDLNILLNAAPPKSDPIIIPYSINDDLYSIPGRPRKPSENVVSYQVHQWEPTRRISF